jgi:hypothetical protein
VEGSRSSSGAPLDVSSLLLRLLLSFNPFVADPFSLTLQSSTLTPASHTCPEAQPIMTGPFSGSPHSRPPTPSITGQGRRLRGGSRWLHSHHLLGPKLLRPDGQQGRLHSLRLRLLTLLHTVFGGTTPQQTPHGICLRSLCQHGLTGLARRRRRWAKARGLVSCAAAAAATSCGLCGNSQLQCHEHHHDGRRALWLASTCDSNAPVVS